MIKVFNKNIILFFILFINFRIFYAFDYDFYVNKYPNVPQDDRAFLHYLDKGFNQGLQSAKKLDNSNFDWKYYVTYNNLDIKSKRHAKEHYKSIGKKQKLKYCKQFKICINLHLYNLGLLNEFVEKINYFMKINKLNDFYIKINVPIWNNIDNYAKNINLDGDKFLKVDDKIFNKVLALTPYHKKLVTLKNYKVLYEVFKKLKSSFNIDQDRIQVIFSENRGVDIGGFFLLSDQILKQNLDIDYVVVLHSKTHNDWRQILTSILKLKVNRLLNYYEYIDSCRHVTFDPCEFPHFSGILDYFDLPSFDKIYFSLGTTFIVSRKLIDFFKPYNMLDIFDQLSFADAFHRSFYTFNIHSNFITRGVTKEHAYTRFLGYLVKYLGLKTRVIDYIK